MEAKRKAAPAAPRPLRTDNRSLDSSLWPERPLLTLHPSHPLFTLHPSPFTPLGPKKQKRQQRRDASRLSNGPASEPASHQPTPGVCHVRWASTYSRRTAHPPTLCLSIAESRGWAKRTGLSFLHRAGSLSGFSSYCFGLATRFVACSLDSPAVVGCITNLTPPEGGGDTPTFTRDDGCRA